MYVTIYIKFLVVCVTYTFVNLIISKHCCVKFILLHFQSCHKKLQVFTYRYYFNRSCRGNCLDTLTKVQLTLQFGWEVVVHTLLLIKILMGTILLPKFLEGNTKVVYFYKDIVIFMFPNTCT